MPVSLTPYSVALLSIQRYRVTVNPLNVRVSSQPTWRATGATIFGVWIVAALLAVPAARSKHFCRLSVFYWRTNYILQMAIFEILTSCVIPLCVIAFSYIMTARHLLKNPSSLTEGAQNPQQKTRKNTAKIVLGLTVVFLISYVPYHITVAYMYSVVEVDAFFDTDSSILSWNYYFNNIWIIVQLFVPINSCLNPVALFCTSRAFRGHFKRYLTCCCKVKSPPTDFELRRKN
jgi:hypothetical protein